jgi:hypothetical protein
MRPRDIDRIASAVAARLAPRRPSRNRQLASAAAARLARPRFPSAAALASAVAVRLARPPRRFDARRFASGVAVRVTSRRSQVTLASAIVARLASRVSVELVEKETARPLLNAVASAIARKLTLGKKKGGAELPQQKIDISQ